MPFSIEVSKVKIDYDKSTDSLYVRFNERPYKESEEVQPGIMLDFDNEGFIVAMDIEHASRFAEGDAFGAVSG